MGAPPVVTPADAYAGLGCVLRATSQSSCVSIA